MSVEQLILKDEVNNSIKIRRGDVGFVLTINDMNKITNAFLTREHGHLLMLYLQEHLR